MESGGNYCTEGRRKLWVNAKVVNLTPLQERTSRIQASVKKKISTLLALLAKIET